MDRFGEFATSEPGLGPVLLKKIKDKIRNYFIAGLLTVVPLSITLYVISALLRHSDRIFDFIPSRYNPKAYIPFPLPGLGVILVLVAIFLIGLLLKNYVGGRIVDFGERIVYQIPLVRPIYMSVKQLLVAIFSQSYEGFKRVVLIEYPRRGIYAMGFVTGVASGEVQELTKERVLNVFLPTTPNPTSGFYLLVPEKDIIPLKMSVEDAFKLIISGGLATPEYGTQKAGSKNARPVPINSMQTAVSTGPEAVPEPGPEPLKTHNP